MRNGEQKHAKKKQWIPDGTVSGEKICAEKACKMSKKMQKGDRHPPCGTVLKMQLIQVEIQGEPT